VLAAWLHRLGHDNLAARALTLARKAKDPVARLREDLAWSAFAGMVHAYMVRADDEALAHGERLLRLYPEEAKKTPQARAVVEDLARRKKKGTFGRGPGKLPDGFDGWDVKKKVAHLIDALDEVDARQSGQPGGVDLGDDPRVRALIKLGDAAVPALIDAVEGDTRLTRSVHFWRDFARSRTVLEVREAALTAVMSILRVRVFEPASTGDNFTARGEDGAKKTAAQLRAYWKKYGGIPFDERMMKVLTDPETKVEALREAAANLARLGEERTLGTTVWSDRAGVRPRGINPALDKFKKPSVAEAILAAMDRDLAAYDAKERDSLYDYERRHLEDAYLFPLIVLGDLRILPELRNRVQAAPNVRMRRKWALACHSLGEAKPLKAFAADFEAGKVPLPANDQENTNEKDQPGTVELREIIGYLAHVETTEADKALAALADPAHPAHALAARHVLRDRPGTPGEDDWFVHPYCLLILRKALDDTTATGATYKIKGDSLKRVEGDGWGSGGLPGLLADPAARREEAAERACDVAAEKLGSLLWGTPEYHVLLKNADKRLQAVKDSFDRYKGKYRGLNDLERHELGLSPWGTVLVPDVRPPDRPATDFDVRAGRALFHLDGKGKLAELKLPAVGVLKPGGKRGREESVLIVQAEVGADGEAVYGIIGRHELRAAKAKEFAKAAPLTPKKEP
jgi:hypothetical protein